jgi:glycosidase
VSFRPPPTWLRDAVLYQVYPQSFADGNGDGIGDLAGLLDRLDYLAWLGVTAVWLTPCYVSPFRDAGYDVSDYLTVAPRYGTSDDLVTVVDAARSHGIRVLLDLVPGHTSDQHPWFARSADDPDDHRYIWADQDLPPGSGWVPSPGQRPGYYLPNFFPIQPALNYGYARPCEAEPWRQPVDAEGPRANRAALRDIMGHWLGLGVSGFRVDMAGSLVKDDPELVETCGLWGDIRQWLDRAYPDAVLFSEWGDPKVSVPAGFHADFFLHFGPANRAFGSLWNNQAGTNEPDWWNHPPYFDPAGGGTAQVFVEAWLEATQAIGTAGYVALPTASHDFSRLACGPRTRDQLGPAFAFLLTWPTLPAIYNGDEIGMRYVPGLPDTEGSRLSPTNQRQGSRTPMQWDDGPNAGFSAAPASDLYLPIDPDPDRPAVAAQRDDEGSLLNLVRRLIALRKASPALRTDTDVRVLHAGYPLVYTRGGSHLVVINPRQAPAAAAVPVSPGRLVPLEVNGVTVSSDCIHADGFSYGVFESTRNGAFDK